MRDPLPFLNSDASLILTIVGLAVLWFVLRKSAKGVRLWLWVLGIVFVIGIVHNTLWGACGRWGPWQTGKAEERRALDDFCTEPADRP